jgi:uncharacterized membrane protein YvbJ
MPLVSCSECGTENVKDARFCTKCGAALESPQQKGVEAQIEQWGEEFGRRFEEWGEDFGKRVEDECFGIPHGGAIIGLIFGVLIVLFGLAIIVGLTLEYFWPAALILFGSLIIIGALYGFTRR